jgi:hypothetical protein
MEVNCQLPVTAAFAPSKIFQDFHWMREWEDNRISLDEVKKEVMLPWNLVLQFLAQSMLLTMAGKRKLVQNLFVDEVLRICR